MPVDLAAFQKLVLNRVSQKTCVTRVTCVTASNNNELGGHAVRSDCVSCVTEAAVGSRGHASRDDGLQDCVTEKSQLRQYFSRRGHAVTRSRTNLGGEKQNDGELADPVASDANSWFAYFEEHAAIREYEGGFDRAVAEELALDETVAALDPRPGTIH
ncbi:hypothetical protein [Methylobacterium sp. J-076]|uniref:hypothetical protein n=1 Tax=Methylobacterium sp. J-076 TaxID=2836655 RepID=UPI001FBA83F5|nr:hypothetical protein [Methylobacterium sp. J-076]MCJ2013631.1 hypothetical protein [Methylobacterium sp. J-076]